jgi:hypothetical protein
VRKDLIARELWDDGKAAHADSSRKLLVDIIGDKPLAEFTKTDAVTFRRTVARLPQRYHRAKEWRDVPQHRAADGRIVSEKVWLIDFSSLTTTTGWRRTSSPSWRATSIAGPTWFSSSTVCRTRCWS